MTRVHQIENSFSANLADGFWYVPANCQIYGPDQMLPLCFRDGYYQQTQLEQRKNSINNIALIEASIELG